MDLVRAAIARGERVAGIAGTFDVANYGDLLFPLIAAAALGQRDPRIRVQPFSVNGRSEPEWPYRVGSMDEMIDAIPLISAMLVGGGQIVRFDRHYPTATPVDVDVPFASWLTPAVLAALLGKPVIWNAVGASVGWARAAWHEQLVRDVLSASAFIGVRDQGSQDALAGLAPDAEIQQLPDTAFSLARVWPLQNESAAFMHWRRSLGVEGGYVVVQASAAVGRRRAEIAALAASLGGAAIVVLPVCWCHGDRANAIPALPGQVFLNHGWLEPKLMSEIIGRAEFVVASSLHACITALSYGVPVARVRIWWGPSKYDLLDAFTGIAHIDQPAALARLVERGRHTEPLAVECADRLDRYWDMVCDTVRHPPMAQGSRATGTMLRWAARACGGRGRPGPTHTARVWLRDMLSRPLGKKRMMLRRWLSAGLARGRRLTARATSVRASGDGGARGAARPRPARSPGARPPVLNLPRIAQQAMDTTPFRWAFIDRLFSDDDAAALAATFPHDQFRTVKGYDGEKGYEYVARSLVHMGADEPSHVEGLSPAWRALADDLLSAEYRSALSQLTGRNLASAPMEVNVVHYGPGAWMGPHLDLKEKVVTHVLYFNEAWDPELGGCLNILKSSDPGDVHATIPPVVGNSVLLVRSNHSWHSVSRVAAQCQTSRRSINVIFHLPGSISTMWPPGKAPVLRDLVPVPRG